MGSVCSSSHDEQVVPQRLSSSWNTFLPRRDFRPREGRARTADARTNQSPLYLMANNFQAASGKMAVSGPRPHPEPSQHRANWVLPGRRFDAPHCPSPLPEASLTVSPARSFEIGIFANFRSSVTSSRSCPYGSWLLSGRRKAKACLCVVKPGR